MIQMWWVHHHCLPQPASVDLNNQCALQMLTALTTYLQNCEATCQAASNLGPMQKCCFCGCLRYFNESPGICCNGNLGVLPPEYSDWWRTARQEFASKTASTAANYYKYLHDRSVYASGDRGRYLNSTVAFSMLHLQNSHGTGRFVNPNVGAVDHRGAQSYFPSMVKMCGRTYHDMLDNANTHNKYNNGLNWYVYDAQAVHNATNNRAVNALHSSRGVKQTDVDNLHVFITALNPFAQKLKQMGELCYAQPPPTLKVQLKWDNSAPFFLSAFITNSTDMQIGKRHFTVHASNGQHGNSKPHTIDILSPFYEPLQYPMFYPDGTAGWHCTHSEKPRSTAGLRMSQINYYSHLVLQDVLINQEPHGGQNTDYCALRFGHLGMLFNEWCVDMWSRTEDEKLNLIKSSNQKQAMRKDIEGQGPKHSGRVKLPKSHVGSTRWKQCQLADTWALMTTHGKPTFFITFTCNSQWNEITKHLKPGQTAADRLDITVRVFNAKLKQFKKRLREKWGHRIYEIGVIEYQDRGYPHAHILLKLEEDASWTPAEMDYFIQASMPPHTRTRARELTRKFMTHSPDKCKKKHKNGTCYYGYCENGGKDLCFCTHVEADTGYVVHKRLNEEDRWVVPTNWDLLEEFECHINIEFAYSVNVIKYLFKYLSKGALIGVGGMPRCMHQAPLSNMPKSTLLLMMKWMKLKSTSVSDH
jgi:hypothetical protein